MKVIGISEKSREIIFFLCQDVEIVQVGVIKYLAAFLRTLSDLCRVSYLPILHEILHSTNPFNWRLRQYLAIQLPELVALPPKPDVYRTLFPTVMTLLQDPVVSVRTVTFKGVSAMLNAIYEVSKNVGDKYTAEEVEANLQNLEEVTRAINNFITSDKCQMRQLWMELCTQLLKDLPTPLFEEYFLPGALILTCDKVLNVRLAVAMFLAGWEPEYPAPWEPNPVNEGGKECPWKWLLARSDIRACVERFKSEDRDIYLNVSKLKPVYPDIEFSSMSVRGRKVPPGGSTPVEINASPAVMGEVVIVPPTVEAIQARSAANSEHGSSMAGRGRSNSGSSFRGSKTGSVDGDNLNRLQRLSLSSKDDDDEEDRVPSTGSDHNENEMPDNEDDGVEKEFVATMVHNPEVEEELDIIDGILKSPSHHKDHEVLDHSSTTIDTNDVSNGEVREDVSQLTESS